jgi:hypothetical protein
MCLTGYSAQSNSVQNAVLVDSRDRASKPPHADRARGTRPYMMFVIKIAATNARIA